MTICPTVVTFKAFNNIDLYRSGTFPHSEYISQSVLDLWTSLWAQQTALPDFIWQNWVKMVAGLDNAGVPLMVGTDLMVPGIIPGYSVHEEMVIWQDAGIPAADILRSATIVPAKFMGLGERLGSISEGKTASFVLIQANPLDDISNAQKIESVFLRGQYYSRNDLNRLLVEAKQLAHP